MAACSRSAPSIIDCRIAAVRAVAAVDLDGLRPKRNIKFELDAAVSDLGPDVDFFGEIRLAPWQMTVSADDREPSNDPARTDPGNSVRRLVLEIAAYERPEGKERGVDEVVQLLRNRVPIAVRLIAARDGETVAESDWLDTGGFRDALLAQLRAK